MKNHKCVRKKKCDVKEEKKSERVRWILRIVGTYHLCVMMVMAVQLRLWLVKIPAICSRASGKTKQGKERDRKKERARALAQKKVNMVCVCVNRFIQNAKKAIHASQTETQHKCSSQKSKKKKHSAKKGKKKCASRKDLKKERKLLAMIEPTHRMFTITCALQSERNTHSFSCSFVSILVSTARLFLLLLLLLLLLLKLSPAIFFSRNNFIAFGDSSAIYHQ